MKKRILFLMLFLTFSLSYSAEKFTCADYEEGTTNSFQFKDETKIVHSGTLHQGLVEYPVFTGTSNQVKNINKEINKLVNTFNKKNTQYEVVYSLHANNASIISFLFTIDENNSNTGTKRRYETLNFYAVTGKRLNIGDLIASLDTLDIYRNEKIRKFGLPKNPDLKKLSKKQQFYMHENDKSMVLVFDPYEATKFADGELFLPIVLDDLVERYGGQLFK